MLTDSTTVVATTIYDHSGTFYLAVLQTVANETCLHLLWIDSKIGLLDQFIAHCRYAVIYIALFEELIMYCDSGGSRIWKRGVPVCMWLIA